MVIHHNKPAKAHGFTLIESAIASVILAVMVVAALNTVGASARSRQILLERRVGWTLANDLMTEIVHLAYLEPVDVPTFGRESVESSLNRSDYDDLDDYNGWTENPPKDKSNNTIPGYSGWQRSVIVKHVDPVTLAVGLDSVDSGIKEITVNVTSPSGKMTTLKALRAKQGSYDMAPPADTTSLEWIGMRIKVGTQGQTMITGVDLLNQPPVSP